MGCVAGDGDEAALITAIETANASGDVIELATDCVYSFTAPYTSPGNFDFWYGPSALPAIANTITINGNGATIERDAAAVDPFRLFFVGADPDDADTFNYTSPGPGNLTLRELTLRGGLAKGGDSGAGGAGAGMGGAIFNQGNVTLDGVTITDNTAEGGSSGVEAGGAGGGVGQDAQATGGGGFGTEFTGGGGAAGGVGGGPIGIGGGGGGLRDAEDGSLGGGGGPATGIGGNGGAANGGSGGNGSGGGGGAAVIPAAIGGAGGPFGFGGSNGAPPFGSGGGGGVGGGGGAASSSGLAGGGGGFGGGGGATGAVPTPGGGFGGFGGGGGGGFGGSGGGTGGFGGGNGGNGNPAPAATGGSGGGGAGMGGAVFNMHGMLIAQNSTLSGNTAQGGGGGDSGGGLGGAIFNLNGFVDADSVTIAFNNATSGRGTGLYNLGYMADDTGDEVDHSYAATALFRNSILAPGTLCPGCFDVVSNAPTVVSNGLANTAAAATVDVSDHDLVVTQDTEGTGQINGAPLMADPNLGDLLDNGGPTPTHALLAGSAAINAGETVLSADQRALPRPSGAADDIGAFELQVVEPTAVPSTATPTPTATAGPTTTPTGTPSATPAGTSTPTPAAGIVAPAALSNTPNPGLPITGFDGTETFELGSGFLLAGWGLVGLARDRRRVTSVTAAAQIHHAEPQIHHAEPQVRDVEPRPKPLSEGDLLLPYWPE